VDTVVVAVSIPTDPDTFSQHPPPGAGCAPSANVDASPASFAPAPAPPSERGAWLLACMIGAIGLAVLVAVLTGVVGRARSVTPPPVPVLASTPVAAAAAVSPAAAAAAAGASAHAHAVIVARPSAVQQSLDAKSFVDDTQTHISRHWMEGFYPIYATAQSTFGVNWLLLASIHKQESAFSTAPGIYHGLNFAHCCGGPMQFNVTNGGTGGGTGGGAAVSTWDEVSDSYIYGKRPAHYNHMTTTHPSIYDDFDAIMAAAHLLSADGAEYALNESAWDAAYDYYGHDATGVTYADQVLARAIGWSQHGFCINCGIEPKMVDAVQAAYGAPVLAGLVAEAEAEAQARLKAAAGHTTRTRKGKGPRS
jgi:hypothetical protein